MLESDNLPIIVAEGPNGSWIKKDAGKVRRFLNDAIKDVKNVGRDIREKASPLRWVSENLWGEYGQKMDLLREVDDQIREWTKDLDNVLDKARDAQKEGRMLDVVFWLSQINNRLKLVSEKSRELSDLQNEEIAKFFGDTKEGIPEDYFETGEHKLVNAGVIDDVGRRLTLWKTERMYKKRLEEQKRALTALMNLASSTVSRVDVFLGRMSKARADGDISGYITALKNVSETQFKFENQFRPIFQKHFSEMANKIRKNVYTEPLPPTVNDPVLLQQNTPPPNVPTVTQVPDLEVEEPTIPGSPILEEVAPKTEIDKKEENILPTVPGLGPDSKKKPEVGLDLSPEHPSQDFPSEKPFELKKQKDESSPETLRSNRSSIQGFILKNQHEKFFNELILTSSTEDPYLMAAMLAKYSQMIEKSDLETSLKLLAVVEGIVDVG